MLALVLPLSPPPSPARAPQNTIRMYLTAYLLFLNSFLCRSDDLPTSLIFKEIFV